MAVQEDLPLPISPDDPGYTWQPFNPSGITQEGGGAQAFQKFIDPHGNTLISINRDGTIFALGVGYPEGSYQSTAKATLPSSIDTGTF